MEPGFLKAIVLAWVSSDAVDFFLNGGVFAGYFRSNEPFIVSPSEAFLRIPLGYGSILLLVLVLAFLIYWRSGLTMNGGVRISLTYGLAVASSSVLGLWSITVAPESFLVIWFVDQVLELSLAGLVLSAVKTGHPGHLTRFVAVGSIVLFAAGILLQNLAA